MPEIPVPRAGAPEYFRVKDHADLIKNRETKAVLNTNHTGLDKYREERERLLQLAKTAQDVQSLKKDIEEIKSLLKEFLREKE